MLIDSKIKFMNSSRQHNRDEIESFINTTKPLPKNFDWRHKHVVTEVKNQGNCGSCWAFAAIATIESAYAIQNNLKGKDLVKFSEQQMVDCAYGFPYKSYGCDGGYVSDVYRYAEKFGVVKEDDYPYLNANYVYVCLLLIS